MEDKIVGPLTLVQFSELTISALIFYVTWRYTSTIITVLVGLPILIFGFLLAFVKVQDQPFSHFFSAALQYLTRPKLRIWKKDPTLEKLAIPASINPVHEQDRQKNLAAEIAKREQTVSQLDQLARILDTRGESAVAEVGGVSGSSIGTKIESARPKVIPVKRK